MATRRQCVDICASCLLLLLALSYDQQAKQTEILAAEAEINKEKRHKRPSSQQRHSPLRLLCVWAFCLHSRRLSPAGRDIVAWNIAIATMASYISRMRILLHPCNVCECHSWWPDDAWAPHLTGQGISDRRKTKDLGDKLCTETGHGLGQSMRERVLWNVHRWGGKESHGKKDSSICFLYS